MKRLLPILMVIFALLMPTTLWAQGLAGDETDEPYAVLSEGNTVLTFYYDEKKVERNGMDVGSFGSPNARGWHNDTESITTVVFDDSFANDTLLTSMYCWFYNCSNLTKIEGIGNLHTAMVTDMTGLFSGCSKLASVDLTGFNTSNVTIMYGMFQQCSSLTTLNVTGFNTAKVEDMRYMFSECSGLKSLDLSSFNVSNVTYMDELFAYCSALTTIYVGSEWLVDSEKTSGPHMFRNCEKLVGGKGTTYDSNHLHVDYAHIDGGTDNPGYFTDIADAVYRFRINVVGDGVVRDATGDTRYSADIAVKRGNSVELKFIPDDGWKFASFVVDDVDMTSEVTPATDDSPASYTYQNVTGIVNVLVTFVQQSMEPYAVLSEDNTVLTFYYDGQKEGRNGMEVTAFYSEYTRGWNSNASKINTVVFDKSFAYYTPTYTTYWFYQCSNLKDIQGIENLNTANVTDMRYMFYGCNSLTDLDLSSFKTDNVTNMGHMFHDCSSLTNLNVSSFNTANVTDLGEMFYGCKKLTNLDVSGFNTANVLYISSMFRGCSGIINLNLESFDTSNVMYMASVFANCSNLTTIYVGNAWSTAAVTDGADMFKNCTSLVGGAGTVYDANHTDYTYAHVDGGTDNPGYFTAKDAKVWSVIGTINGEWDKDTEMTSEDGVNYTASFPYLAASSYEFKIRANSDWTENYGYEGEPGGKNIPVVVEENLTTVVVSFNADTKQIVYELQAPVYSIIGGKVDENGEPVNGWLNWAEDADMTKTESGQYVLKFDNMEAGSYQFKVRVNHEWTYNWGLDGKQDGENDILDLEHSVPVTFYFDPVTKITLVEVPVVDNDAEPYAVLSEENTVLTFYYDEKKAERNGMSVGPFDGNEEYPTWYNARESIKSIVFDNSFAKCESITSTAFWFFNCYNATSITGINNLNTSNVTNMSYMFGGCSVSDLDLSSFNTANVTNMYGMFSSCYGLHSLDLSSFNTAKVTDMGLMFQANEYLKHINLSSFNTANVTNMNGMFNVCTHLESLDVSSFNTENVKDMGWMFRSCPNLTSLDLSNFNTTNVTNMHYMFEKSSNLATIYVGSDWRTELVTDGTDMFKDCTSLVGGAGTIYDANHIDYTYAHIDEGASNPGYFTDKNAPVINVTLNEYGVLSVNSDVTMAEALEEASKKHNVEKWITAIVWNSNKPISNSELQSLTNPNMLIFVPADSLAPQNRDNVVIGDLAKNIVLKDVTEGNGSFYSPKSFKAEMISYTHEYRQQTEIGVARGWETIALPFTVQTIMHEKQGRIVPFGISDSGANFWLRQMTSNGLQRATQIEANVPYIISMPNNEAYYAQNNLAGRVTFSSQDAMVPMTEYTAVHMQVEGGMLMFVPCFQTTQTGNMIYALNVGEARGNHPEGSVFEANYRDIRPFEAYTVHEGNYGPAPQYIPVFDLNEAGFTGIEEVRSQMSDGRSDVWYDLNGRRLQSEPTQKGVYLRNGRKVIIR